MDEMCVHYIKRQWGESSPWNGTVCFIWGQTKWNVKVESQIPLLIILDPKKERY